MLSKLGLRIEQWLAQIVSYDPRPWLKAGWTRLYRENSEIVKSVDDLTQEEVLEAHLIDGKVNLKVSHMLKKEV